MKDFGITTVLREGLYRACALDDALRRQRSELTRALIANGVETLDDALVGYTFEVVALCAQLYPELEILLTKVGARQGSSDDGEAAPWTSGRLRRALIAAGRAVED